MTDAAETKPAPSPLEAEFEAIFAEKLSRIKSADERLRFIMYADITRTGFGRPLASWLSALALAFVATHKQAGLPKSAIREILNKLWANA